MKFSIIVPVFKREDEVTELLESLTAQNFSDFEVIISDGSPDDSLRRVVDQYREALKLNYIYFKGYNASESRNAGCKQAKGEFLFFFDSDCIIPEDYFSKVCSFLSQTPLDAFGGPDAAKDDFNNTMKGINYAMTSLFTTGGIRGKKRHVGKFLMRGFNMAVKKEVFYEVGGFSGMDVAEDIELSVRINKAGYKSGLIPDAFVFHKRKSNFRKFFNQLKMHGKGRIDLFFRHRNQLKLIHFFPSLFLAYLIFLLSLFFFNYNLFLIGALPVGFYLILIFIDASLKYKSVFPAFYSVAASFIMLNAYGLGLIQNGLSRMIAGKNQETEKLEELKN
ncbi:MAG: glycosyltransferase [Ekhidna sp.]|nr:glycosyltransferase [Ekhidna sp.]